MKAECARRAQQCIVTYICTYIVVRVGSVYMYIEAVELNLATINVCVVSFPVYTYSQGIKSHYHKTKRLQIFPNSKTHMKPQKQDAS